jgi:tetratricopeptide (TPR) repeat protein
VRDFDRKSSLDKNTTEGTASGSKYLRNSLIVLVGVLVVVVAARIYRPPETPFDKAVTLIRQGKAAAALPMLEQLSVQHPANPAIFPWLAQGYLATDRIPEGRIALDTALRMGLPVSSVSPTILLYANFYQRKGDFAEAGKLLSSLPPESISEDLARFYVDWSDYDLSHGQLVNAVDHLEKAGDLLNSVSETLRALIRHRLGEGYRRLAALAETDEKNDQKAISLLEKSLKVSDEPATRMILANIYSRNDMQNQAIENYRAVALVDKNNLEARHHLIDLLIERGDFDGAQSALVELIEKEKSLENYQQLASADLKLKNYAGAVHALEDACELGVKPEILKQLLAVLSDWCAQLTKEKKLQEAVSVKGHADRVAEQLAQIVNEEQAEKDAEADKLAAAQALRGDLAPIALVSSRIWLAAGSVTPEGEIKIKNVSRKPVRDLTLKVVFLDNTARHATGTVNLPVATPSSAPFGESDVKTLYFSCPNTVRKDERDHQLAVRIMWKNHFLKEFPVNKQL